MSLELLLSHFFTPSRKEIWPQPSTKNEYPSFGSVLPFSSMSSVRDVPSGMPAQLLQLQSAGPLFHTSTPIYPTQAPSTTPVTLQQPSGTYILSFIFSPFWRMLPADTFHPCPILRVSLAWPASARASFRRPWRSPTSIDTRRYHATRSSPRLSVSACMCLQTLRCAFDSYHNVQRGNLHVESSDDVSFPCAGQTWRILVAPWSFVQ